jgi:hypothetical protein
MKKKTKSIFAFIKFYDIIKFTARFYNRGGVGKL